MGLEKRAWVFHIRLTSSESLHPRSTHGRKTRRLNGSKTQRSAGQAATDVPGGHVQRRLHADGIRGRGIAAVLRRAAGTGYPDHAQSSYGGSWRLWHLSEGRRLDQGRTSHRIFAPAPASVTVRDGGNMIAQELEVSLHMAFVEARQKRHEFITVEHLLLALCDNPSASEVLKACAAKIDELKKALSDFVMQHTPTVAGTGEVDTQPTLGFQRVIQRAILHVQSSGKKEVTGANVLVAIYGEKDSHAVYFLHQQGVSRLDVVNFISHGITKAPQAPGSREEGETEAEAPEAQAGGAL